MKYLQILVCVLLVTSFVTANQNNLLKKKTNKKGIVAWLFKDWNSIKTTVTNSNGQKFEFDAQIRHIFHDVKQEQPYGIQFQGLNKVTQNDNTGFVKNCLAMEKIAGQKEEPKPVLDYRLVQSCNFYDNSKDWFGDWRIEFNVQGNEQNAISKGRSDIWHVKIVLPAIEKDQALKTIQALNENCVTRSNQINAAKSVAISKGEVYYAAYLALQNRKASLNDLIQLGDKQANVLNAVQSNGNQLEAKIKENVKQNQEQLEKALQELKETQAASISAESDVESSATKLATVQSKLTSLNFKSGQVDDLISSTQRKLNEAINLKNAAKDTATQLSNKASMIKANAEREQQEIAAKLQAQQENVQKLQAEFEKQQQALQAKLAKDKAALDAKIAAAKSTSQQKQSEIQAKADSNANAQQKNADQLQTYEESIATLMALISSYESQSKQLQTTIQNTQSTVSQVQDNLNKRRTVSQQVAAQLSIETQISQQQDQQLEELKQQAQQELDELAEAEQRALDLLTSKKEEVDQARAYAAKAKEDVSTSYLAFNHALNQIVELSEMAKARTIRALEKKNKNQFADQINSIITQTKTSMRLARMRLAKYVQQKQRLAKLMTEQVEKVRLARQARKNMRNARKHHKRAHKN